MSELSANNLVIPKVYAPVIKDELDRRYFILASGRIAGKTSILVALWYLTYINNPERDIIVLQATQAEIDNSIIVEIEKFLQNSGFSVGDDPNNEFYIPKAKNKVKWRKAKGCTYFFPITDSKGGQRSRGITTTNPLSLVLYEEAQKNKDRNIVEQSVATFIRQLDKDAKLVIVGNNETAGHWFVDYVNEKKLDPAWCYIYANCYDIWGLLNQDTKDYIEQMKKNNNIEFRRMFLGDVNASTADVVFPQFKREESYKKLDELEEARIVKVIVGIDHATANDKFAVVPVAILNNGKTQTLQVLCDDPKETNVTLAPTEQCELLDRFLAYLDDFYDFTANHVGIVLSVDGAASPFIAQLKHTKKTSPNKRMWRNIMIKGFTMKKKDVNLGIIKNAFAFKVLTILDEGQKTWDNHFNKHRLAKEIESQRYKNGKLDPAIENDLCDALEYGLIPYYSNCYNLSFPIRRQNNENHYDDITRSMKK